MEDKVQVDFDELNSEQTGGGCIAFRYNFYPTDYFVYITNDANCEIRINDQDLTFGLYRNNKQLTDGDYMKIWKQRNILDFQVIFEEAFTMTEQDYMFDDTHKLLDDGMMVIEYISTHSTSLAEHYGDTQREFFDLREIDHSIEDSIEVLHRKLGHNKFKVLRIFT